MSTDPASPALLEEWIGRDIDIRAMHGRDRDKTLSHPLYVASSSRANWTSIGLDTVCNLKLRTFLKGNLVFPPEFLLSKENYNDKEFDPRFRSAAAQVLE